MAPLGTSTVKLPMPEQIIAGKYRIISRLGGGGMGLVYLAEQLGPGTKVALKFLDPEPSEDESRASRFLREARVALQVQHPGSTQILDLGQDEAQRLYMCFELVEGEDLRELIKREGRLRAGEARSVTLQVAAVLAFAHERNIVHRDVKPENLRVWRDAAGIHIKVLDFGIARLLKDTNLRLTAEGMLAGTPRYMAPEQVKDEAIDGRIDQYALGLVLFEMLTGAVAIGGKNVTQILMHQLKSPVPPLTWVDPELAHEGFDAFIARACAKEPSHRFPSMSAFITALEAVSFDEARWPAVKAPPANPGSSTTPTRDGAAPAKAPVVEGVSQTLVRREAPTDPEREPVSRRETKAHSTLTPGVAVTTAQQAHAPTGDGARPIALTPSRVVHPVIELPTDPERPAVSRSKETIPSRREFESPRQKQISAAMPAAPVKRSSPWLWVLLGVVLGLISLAVAGWWYTHR